MRMHILVALDGSGPAEQGLAEATALARRLVAQGVYLRLFLAQATEPPMFSGVDTTQLRLALLTSARAYLEHLAQPLRAEGLDVEIVVREGAAAAVLIESIEQQAIDLVVMATHGRSGMARWVLGSVAEEVAEHATVPVLLVPRDGPPVAPAVDREWRILLPLDGTPLTEGVLVPTARLAQALGAEVRLLHVLLPMYQDAPAKDPLHQLPDERRRFRDAEHYLEEQVAHLQQLGVAARWSLAFGTPAEDIAERAERYHSDIVVLTRQARKAAMLWPGGSIPRRLLRSEQAAVLFMTPTVAAAITAVATQEREERA